MKLKEFADMVKQDKTIFVLFSAPWCGPCKKVKKLLADYKDTDKVVFKIINVDDNEDLASLYEIETIPTIKVFKNSEKEIDTISDGNTDNVKKFIDKYNKSSQ